MAELITVVLYTVAVLTVVGFLVLIGAAFAVSRMSKHEQEKAVYPRAVERRKAS